MDDKFFEQYKTPDQREFLLRFKRADETEEEFWKTVPNGAWLIAPTITKPSDEDIEWGLRVLQDYKNRK